MWAGSKKKSSFAFDWKHMKKQKITLFENFSSKNSKIRLGNFSFLLFLQINQIFWNFPWNTEINHPIHQMKCEKHNGKYDSAIFINITCAHAENSIGRLGRREWWWELDLQLLPGVVFLSVPRQRVMMFMASIQCACHHAASVKPNTGLQLTLLRTKILYFKL